MRPFQRRLTARVTTLTENVGASARSFDKETYVLAPWRLQTQCATQLTNHRRELVQYLALIALLSAPLLSQDKSTFVDSTLGYVIQYPNFISLRTKPDYPGAIVYYHGKWILALDDSEIPPDQPNFRSFALDLAIRSCSADGPDGSQWAEDIDSAQVKKNKYGITYVELFLRKSETFESKTKSENVGPFFVVDISSSNKRQGLILDWRPNWMPTPIQIKACRTIVENIKLLNQ